ncbi:MAG: hypothetical protein IKN54_08725 [Lachnospiraceae bacterium]|nr:hypothetical protein [Lachnospiraceae bacterium]
MGKTLTELLKKIDSRQIAQNVFLQKYGLTSLAMKLIALLTMIVDHTACVLLHRDSLYILFRGIGRLSFPIFCFVLTESFTYTRSKYKLFCRLLFFAVVSEIPFDIALYNRLFYWHSQNVIWQFVIAVAVMWCCEVLKNSNNEVVNETPGQQYKACDDKYNKSKKEIKSIVTGWCERALYALKKQFGQQESEIIVICIGVMCSIFGHVSYSYLGVVLIIMFYYFREHLLLQMLANAFVNIGLAGGLQSLGTISVLPMMMYNGKSGRLKLKWMFYLIYPLHLMALWAIYVIYHYSL